MSFLRFKFHVWYLQKNHIQYFCIHKELIYLDMSASDFPSDKKIDVINLKLIQIQDMYI